MLVSTGSCLHTNWRQGGQIAANAFCGGQGSIFGDNEPIPSEAVENGKGSNYERRAATKKSIAKFLRYSRCYCPLWQPQPQPRLLLQQGHQRPRRCKFPKTAHVLYTLSDSLTRFKTQIFVRDEEGACSNFADKIVSYCDDGDVYCDAGQNDTVHGLYLERYSQEVQDFVVSQYNAALNGDDGDGSSTTSAAPTHSATGSSMTAAPTGGNATMTTSHMPPTPTDGGDDDEKPTTPPATGAAAGLTANNLVVALPMAMIAAVQML